MEKCQEIPAEQAAHSSPLRERVRQNRHAAAYSPRLHSQWLRVYTALPVQPNHAASHDRMRLVTSAQPRGFQQLYRPDTRETRTSPRALFFSTRGLSRGHQPAHWSRAAQGGHRQTGAAKRSMPRGSFCCTLEVRNFLTPPQPEPENRVRAEQETEPSEEITAAGDAARPSCPALLSPSQAIPLAPAYKPASASRLHPPAACR